MNGDILQYKKSDIKRINFAVKKTEITLLNLLLFIAVFFSSRVFILKTMMPFGLSLLIAAAFSNNLGFYFFASLFCTLGYLSRFLGGISIGHGVSAFFICFYYIVKGHKSNKVKFNIISFISIFIILLFFRTAYITVGIVPFDVIVIFLEVLSIAAFSYIFSYGISNIKKNKALSREELISFLLLTSISIAGFFDTKIYGFSIKLIIALIVILLIGNIKGADKGAASGIMIGIFLSLSGYGKDYTSIFGILGLSAGIFREKKVLSCLSFIIVGVILSMNPLNLEFIEPFIVEILIALFIYLLIPKKTIEKLQINLGGEVKVRNKNSYGDRVKDIIDKKLSDVSNCLTGLSEILKKDEESNLYKKNEATAMVQRLADRVCSNCGMNNMCWKENAYYTYDIFLGILRKIEKSGMLNENEANAFLKDKCAKHRELLKQVNQIYELYRINNSWKKKIVNSRLILSEQIKWISDIVADIARETALTYEFKSEVEEEIIDALHANSLDFEDVIAMKNSSNKYEVTVIRKPCKGKRLCAKGYEESISKALGVKMIREESNCSLYNEKSNCRFNFYEAENFYVVSSVLKEPKDDVSGDSHIFGPICDGKYIIALSDGMGSGPLAAKESNTTISLLEKLVGAGFNRERVIKAVNSILVLRSSNETYATIDLSLIDLYTGIGEFIKIGAAPSFIISGKEIKTIRSESLPAGILNELDIESEIIPLKNGDIIVMVSDGIIESHPDKEKWVTSALSSFCGGNPRDIGEYLIGMAGENLKGKKTDDMTVVVSKIWKLN